jgi:hypothetical protein
MSAPFIIHNTELKTLTKVRPLKRLRRQSDLEPIISKLGNCQASAVDGY